MSAQTAQKVTDVSRFEQVSRANVAMMETMHNALSEIAKCEISLDGGVAQKHIAEFALVKVHKIANDLEVKNAQN